MSLAGVDPSHYASAARIAVEQVTRINADGLPRHSLLNVNVPDLPYDEVQGIRVTRLGQWHKAATAIRQFDPSGRPVRLIGPAGPPGDDAGPGTDLRAIADGYVSVAPLQMDLTAYGLMDALADRPGK